MKIIAVNISRNIKTIPTVIGATRRAWLLNKKRAKDFHYVVGVANGNIQESFKLQSVIVDRIQTNRLAFNLTPCNITEQRRIKVALTNQNLSRFVTKYIQP
jgi:hypothetical protein